MATLPNPPECAILRPVSSRPNDTEANSPTGREILSSPTLLQNRKVALPQRARKAKPINRKALCVALFFWLAPALLIPTGKGGVVVGVWLACFFVGAAVLSCWPTRRKDAKPLNCLACGSAPVVTPYCPWCGTKDPLGDYDEWYQEFLAEERRKREEEARKGRSKGWGRKGRTTVTTLEMEDRGSGRVMGGGQEREMRKWYGGWSGTTDGRTIR